MQFWWEKKWNLSQMKKSWTRLWNQIYMKSCIPGFLKIFKLKGWYLSKKTRFKWFQCNHMIHIHSIPSQFLLPSPFKPKYITPPNETVMYVCADLTTLADIYYKLEWKYTSLCLNNNQSLITELCYICICVRWMNLPFQSTVQIFYLHLKYFGISKKNNTCFLKTINSVVLSFLHHENQTNKNFCFLNLTLLWFKSVCENLLRNYLSILSTPFIKLLV